MKTLHLTLEKQWFDMIASGEKKEEYREIKTYWKYRLCVFASDDYCVRPCLECYRDNKSALTFCNVVKFYLGYDDNDRPQMTFKIKGISVGKGKEEWGAEKGKVYFVIKLGERIE